MDSRALECSGILWVWYLALPSERREFSLSSLPDCVNKCGVSVVGEILKFGSLSILFTHEEQRSFWRQQVRSGCDLQCLARDQGVESVSLCAVSDLVVVLRKGDKLGQRARI